MSGILTFLDTHVAIWLYAGELENLSAAAKNAVEGDEGLVVSPMVLLEMQYLRDIKRLHLEPDELIRDLNGSVGLTIADISFREVVVESRALSWTRDPFDRLIVGHAVSMSAPLVTKDESIRNRYSRAVW